MHVTAVVLAAGRGLRLKSKISKPLIKIGSRPLIVYCLDILSRHPYISDIIVVANRGNLEDVRSKIKKYRISKVKGVVLGGETRQESAANGLREIEPRTDLVLIHDGGRPFINKKMVSSVITLAGKFGAAIVGVPVKATIKEVTRSQRSAAGGSAFGGHQVTRVVKTIDRSRLWEVQTPQVFKKDLILKAYKKFGKTPVTDDSMLVEKLGKEVSLVPGSYNNIKITTPEDLVLAQAIAKNGISHRHWL